MDDPSQPLTVEELSKQCGWPMALLRICIDCGCPTVGDKLAFLPLVAWFGTRYEAVRYLAALPPLVFPGGTKQHSKGAIMDFAVNVTVIDFFESRQPNEGFKRVFAKRRQAAEAEFRKLGRQER